MSVTEKPNNFLPYGRQSIGQDDIDAVVDVLKGDYLTTGPTVSTFENALSQRLDAQAVAVNSGTAALHLAYLALGIGPGDVVIVPTITYVATANAALLCGAEVIFSDVDSESGLMGPRQFCDTLERSKNKNVRAVVPVHLGGQTEQLSEIFRVAKARDLWVIEDACHAIGTQYVEDNFDYPIGHCRHSDATIFSFHPVKTIAMGEGGAVTTREESVYRKVQLLRSHGVERVEHRGPWYYEMQALGFNYRVTDVQCALGLSQLKKLDVFRARRRLLADRYDRLLAPLSPVVKPVLRTPFSQPCWHLYSVLIDFDNLSLNRSELMLALRERGIGTQVHYIPVNAQPFYEKRYGVTALSGAKQYYARTLSLPLYSTLTESNVDYIVETLQDLLGQN